MAKALTFDQAVKGSEGHKLDVKFFDAANPQGWR